MRTVRKASECGDPDVNPAARALPSECAMIRAAGVFSLDWKPWSTSIEWTEDTMSVIGGGVEDRPPKASLKETCG